MRYINSHYITLHYKGSLCAATEEGGVDTPITAVILLRACVDFIWAQDPHASSKVYVSWQ